MKGKHSYAFQAAEEGEKQTGASGSVFLDIFTEFLNPAGESAETGDFQQSKEQDDQESCQQRKNMRRMEPPP